MEVEDQNEVKDGLGEQEMCIGRIGHCERKGGSREYRLEGKNVREGGKGRMDDWRREGENENKE